MNNQLKLIIYIGMIVGIFLIVQDKFNLFNISWKDGTIVVNDEFEGEENSEGTPSDDEESYVEIEIPNGLAVRVGVEIADDDLERSRGLSGRSSLGDYEGMLFVFQNEVNNPFWMKDMLISLDIVFIDSDNFIVDIKGNQQPCSDTYCPSVYSNENFMYVLEVNSDFCAENDIEVGYHVVQYLHD
ncbi:MAG: DUF192 domain-containing protein [Candidatus Dojkabacteria bacterium]|nr:DUF192 domain-containing protein [Candidatus Dojkabacteria bacterium]